MLKAKADKYLNNAWELHEHEDIELMKSFLMRKMEEEDCDALELAAVMLKAQVGDKGPEIEADEADPGRGRFGKGRRENGRRRSGGGRYQEEGRARRDGDKYREEGRARRDGDKYREEGRARRDGDKYREEGRSRREDKYREEGKGRRQKSPWYDQGERKERGGIAFPLSKRKK